MKANEFNVRPGSRESFSVYWHYDINKAKEIFSGTEDYCYTMLGLINETLSLVQDRVYQKYTEEKFNQLKNEDEMLQILVGGLLFEFVSRDFYDGAGGEVNVECFILGKDTGYGYTGGFDILDGKLEKDGIPYDDEYCTHYYHKDTKNNFEATRKMVIEDIQKFIVTKEEYLKYAVATDLTWESIKCD